MLRNKIVYLKKFYKIYFDYFVIRRVVSIWTVENDIKNNKFHISIKIYEIQKKIFK